MDLNDLQSDNLPQIDIKDKNLPLITKQSWDALVKVNNLLNLFIHGNHIVRLVDIEKGQIEIVRLDKHKLRHVLARCAKFRTLKNGVYTTDLPPMWVIDDLLAHSKYPLKRLSRIVYAPIFSKKGKLQINPGYSSETECYLHYADNFKIPEVPLLPSEHHIIRAKNIIFGELLYNFPFTGKAERAHAVCLLLFPCTRSMIRGATPIFEVEASTSGTGKTHLVKAVTNPWIARTIEVSSEVQSNGEMRKRVTATLMRSPSFVFIDNLNSKINYSSLASVITAEHWEDRILGESRTVRLPVTSAFIISGNNPSLSSEMARRCVRIRIDTGLEQPGRRKPSEFKHPDLLGWVEENRGDIVWACLVLVQNWIARGQPLPVNNLSLGFVGL